MKPVEPDPVMAELREIRERISAQVGHDPRKVVAYFQQLESQLAEKLVAPIAPTVIVSPEATVKFDQAPLS